MSQVPAPFYYDGRSGSSDGVFGQRYALPLAISAVTTFGSLLLGAALMVTMAWRRHSPRH